MGVYCPSWPWVVWGGWVQGCGPYPGFIRGFGCLGLCMVGAAVQCCPNETRTHRLNDLYYGMAILWIWSDGRADKHMRAQPNADRMQRLLLAAVFGRAQARHGQFWTGRCARGVATSPRLALDWLTNHARACTHACTRARKKHLCTLTSAKGGYLMFYRTYGPYLWRSIDCLDPSNRCCAKDKVHTCGRT